MSDTLKATAVITAITLQVCILIFSALAIWETRLDSYYTACLELHGDMDFCQTYVDGK